MNSEQRKSDAIMRKCEALIAALQERGAPFTQEEEDSMAQWEKERMQAREVYITEALLRMEKRRLEFEELSARVIKLEQTVYQKGA